LFGVRASPHTKIWWRRARESLVNPPANALPPFLPRRRNLTRIFQKKNPYCKASQIFSTGFKKKKGPELIGLFLFYLDVV